MQQWRADPLTERLTQYDMRITALEGRMTEFERERSTEDTDSKHEPPKLVSTIIREWQPLLVSLVILAGVLLGKLSIQDAIGLLRGAP